LVTGIPPQALAAPVGSIMTHEVICVRPDVSVDELVLLLVEHGISGVPVVDEAGRPIGVASRADVLWESYDETESRSEETRANSFTEEIESHPRPHVTVGEIMTSTALSLPESATLSQAAAVMVEQGVHRLPIVDETGVVVGIVSASDLLAWFARSAGYVVPRRFPKKG
jgi:CBS domain-containing protein